MSTPNRSPVTPSQIRAGRAMLNWSQEELAKKAQVGLSSLRDFENERRGSDVGVVKAIVITLQEHGVVFLPSDDNFGPGIRLGLLMPNVLRRPKRVGRFDGLVISVEWRGKEVDVCISQTALDDFGRFQQIKEDMDYFDLFEKNRSKILQAAASAIDNGRVMPDQRVHLTYEDIAN